MRSAFAPWLTACLLAAALQVQAGTSVRDDRGATLVFERAPERIVSLLPSLTESVCALGACNRLVGTDRYSNHPASVQSLPKLGGLEDAQVERIVALRPDVVLVEPSARVIERLESLGLRVVVMEARNHGDVRRTLAVLAQLLGTPAEAQAAWQRIEADMAQALRMVPATARGLRVYVEIDTTPYAAGTGSFIGETLAALGLRNIVAPELGPFPRLNPEFVVRAQPDLILAARSGLADMTHRPGWGSLTALRQGRSCGFAPAQYELIVRPGPRMGVAAQLIAQCVAALPTTPATGLRGR